jgi:hypothetical protein
VNISPATAVHLTAGGRGFERLVLDDRDRWDLVERVRGALGASLLAWCIMDTHLHVVAEGAAGLLTRRLDAALLAYARAFNRRHGRRGGLLRGPSAATPVPGPFELGRAIRYVHENPVSADLAADAIEWPWSSARAFAGLVRERLASVARARALVDPRAIGMLGRPVTLAEAAPADAPSHMPFTLLLAAAQALALDPAAIVGARRDPAPTAGRALFVRLGLLEGYQHRQLAPILGVTRQRITQHAAKEVDPLDVRRARTLLRDPRLVLPGHACPAAGSEGRSPARGARVSPAGRSGGAFAAGGSIRNTLLPPARRSRCSPPRARREMPPG